MGDTIEGKITITKCEKIPGKDFWGFESKGVKGTIWDEQIAADVCNNIGVSCDAVVKSTDGGKHWNLRAFTPVNKGSEEISVPVEKVVSSPVDTSELMSNKDASILAQCLTKATATIAAGRGKEVDIIEISDAVLTTYNHLLKKLE